MLSSFSLSRLCKTIRVASATTVATPVHLFFLGGGSSLVESAPRCAPNSSRKKKVNEEMDPIHTCIDAFELCTKRQFWFLKTERSWNHLNVTIEEDDTSMKSINIRRKQPITRNFRTINLEVKKKD